MSSKNTPQRILFAHQSTIPHYRVPFYQALEKLRPQTWQFEVVFDRSELDEPQFFQEPLNPDELTFPLLDVKTYFLHLKGKRVSYQTFWRHAATYDLLIIENAVNNLAYPLVQLHQFRGSKVAYWGHGRDRSVDEASYLKRASESFKFSLAKRADGFFAYTSGVGTYLLSSGLAPDRVFVVNNTIDIEKQRRLFETWRPKRPAIREEYGLGEHKTLLFVGRFTPNKRIDLLLSAFDRLLADDPDYKLLLVGSGGDAESLNRRPNVTYLGPIVDPERLAQIYVASDIFSFPGSVGLGPLQALCYDLPVITIDSAVQMPEFDYLNDNNAIILPAATSAPAYAQTIAALFEKPTRLQALRGTVWPSIKHLTIEQMAQNFIHGINTILSA